MTGMASFNRLSAIGLTLALQYFRSVDPDLKGKIPTGHLSIWRSSSYIQGVVRTTLREGVFQ